MKTAAALGLSAIEWNVDLKRDFGTVQLTMEIVV